MIGQDLKHGEMEALNTVGGEALHKQVSSQMCVVYLNHISGRRAF